MAGATLWLASRTSEAAGKTKEMAQATEKMAIATEAAAAETKLMAEATKVAADAAEKSAKLALRTLAVAGQPIWYPTSASWSFELSPGPDRYGPGSKGKLSLVLQNVGDGFARLSMVKTSVRLRDKGKEVNGGGTINNEWLASQGHFTVSFEAVKAAGESVGESLWAATMNVEKPQSVGVRFTFANASKSIWWTEWITMDLISGGKAAVVRQDRSEPYETEHEAIEAHWPFARAYY